MKVFTKWLRILRERFGVVARRSIRRWKGMVHATTEIGTIL